MTLIFCRRRPNLELSTVDRTIATTNKVLERAEGEMALDKVHEIYFGSNKTH